MSSSDDTTSRLSTVGSQYEVQTEDGSWVMGTIVQINSGGIVTVEFDRVYPRQDFAKEKLEADVLDLLKTGELRWLEKKTRTTKIILGPSIGKRKSSGDDPSVTNSSSPTKSARISPTSPPPLENSPSGGESRRRPVPIQQVKPTVNSSGAAAGSGTASSSTSSVESANGKSSFMAPLARAPSADLPEKSLAAVTPPNRRRVRPAGLKIKITPSPTTFEMPEPPPKTPVSVKSEQATPLHRAVLSGNSAEVEVILKTSGFSILNKQDESGYSALMSAVALANCEVGMSICRLLLAEGANVMLHDHEGFTAFHWCAAVGNDAICKYLSNNCSAGMLDVNAKSKNGDTALHRACRLGRVATIKTLVEDCKVDIHTQNRKSMTPFDVCGRMFGKKHVLNRRNGRRALTSAKGGEGLKSLLLYHPDCDLHETPEAHFEGQERIPAILEHLQNDGTFASPLCTVSTDFSKLSREHLLYAHTRRYVDVVYNPHNAVIQTGTSMPFTSRVQEGVSHSPSTAKTWSDTSFSPGSLAAALRAAGGACHAVNKVMKGEFRNAMVLTRPPGHHAGRNGLEEDSKSCGFCIFNNVAIAALYALEKKLARRVAIVDFDIHHGQGTEEILEHANRPDELLFVSAHLYQKTQGYEFYPGTGKEMGNLEQNVINVPLAPLWTKQSGTTPTNSLSSTRSGRSVRRKNSDDSTKPGESTTKPAAAKVSKGGVSSCCGMGRQTWKNQIEHRVLPSLRAFNPDLILLSAGFDAGKNDVGNMNLQNMFCPRIGMDLSPDDYVWVTDKINDVARLCCNSKVVSVLEGGYGKWGKRNGKVIIDRTLLANNCTSHVRALVGNYLDD